ncbi:hypothetical protein GCM10022204_00520 [Microlunatus aurantiacus]|uniref:Uncharacterized protein n=1 Tax=Microlunatus aurantiacus TaxID=446786 RepID=A0ABP7CIY0_9ACTN
MDSAGLLLAAVATGSCDMPSKEPLPVFGTEAQPAPNGSVIEAVDADADGLAGADMDGLLIGADEVPPAGAAVLLSIPQAAALSGSRIAAVRAARRVAFLRVFVIMLSSGDRTSSMGSSHKRIRSLGGFRMADLRTSFASGGLRVTAGPHDDPRRHYSARPSVRPDVSRDPGARPR